jgi:hypothetical protein
MLDVLPIIDRNNDVCMPGQPRQASELLRPNHLVGYQDVSDPRRSHQVGFVKLRTGHADCPSRQHFMGDCWNFLPFDMRSPMHPVSAASIRNPGNICLHDVQVDDECWSIQFLLPAPWNG